jgi:hypothetical protein
MRMYVAVAISIIAFFCFQVAFLHSIIADQKRKETALKEEIAILQRLPDDM